jgi:hypothetical protein
MQTRAFVVRLCLALAGLGCCAWSAQAQHQFVVAEATYTATTQNTMDSHFFVMPAAGTPANWRAPTDYASGTAHARVEVLEKPSTRKTLYNICFEGTPTAACMGYSPVYTAPGVLDFSFAFSTFYQYSAVDWTKGINRVALILKDENGNKMQGDAAFYPTKIHVTITIVAPDATYVPPTFGSDAGTDAAVADAGVVKDAGKTGGAAGAAAPKDAGVKMQPADAGAPPRTVDAGTRSPVLDAAAQASRHDARSVVASPDSGTGSDGSSATTSAQQSEPARAGKGGCAVTNAHRSKVPALPWLVAIWLASRRARTPRTRRRR